MGARSFEAFSFEGLDLGWGFGLGAAKRLTCGIVGEGRRMRHGEPPVLGCGNSAVLLHCSQSRFRRLQHRALATNTAGDREGCQAT